MSEKVINKISVANPTALPVLEAAPLAEIEAPPASVLVAEPVAVAAVSYNLAPLVMAPVAAPWLHQAVVAAVPPPKPEQIVRTVEVGRNMSLTKLLVAEADLEEADVAAVTNALINSRSGRK